MFSKEINSRIYFILIVIIIILSIILIYSIFTSKDILFVNKNTDSLSNVYNEKTQSSKKIYDEDKINILATSSNEFNCNNIWSSTFQILWNDLMITDFENESSDKIVSENESIALLNNKRQYEKSNVREDDMYNAYGLATTKFKKDIVSNLNKKYKSTSTMLDNVKWDDNTKSDYVLYSSLNKSLTILNNYSVHSVSENFKDYTDVPYYLIAGDNKTQAKKEISVLYYDKESDAIVLTINSKEGDKITFAKNISGRNFDEILDTINNLSSSYTGIKYLSADDLLKIPVIGINLENNIYSLENAKIENNDKEYIINEAIEKIVFKATVNKNQLSKTNIEVESFDGRKFYFDTDFYIFVTEEKGNEPYFAAYIENIELYNQY